MSILVGFGVGVHQFRLRPTALAKMPVQLVAYKVLCAQLEPEFGQRWYGMFFAI
jgi:hypothetical protein